jgi:hypothetical protein
MSMYSTPYQPMMMAPVTPFFPAMMPPQAVFPAPVPPPVAAAGESEQKETEKGGAAGGEPAAAVSGQNSVQFQFEEQLSGQASMYDWQSLRVSPSGGSFFGISPMPSLGFGP